MDSFVGEIRIFSGNYPPRGWAFCNGQQLNIGDYEALYAIIGHRFGGDKKTYFNLPNFMGKVPVHAGLGVGLKERVLAENGGEYEVTLTTNEIPSHTHLAKSGTIPDVTAPSAATVWSDTKDRGGAMIYNNTADIVMNPLAISVAGGSQPHNNMQPCLGLTFIISLTGEYPIPE